MGAKKKCLAQKHTHFIQLLASYRKNPKQLKNLLKFASVGEINALTEVVLNILRGVLPCIKPKKKVSVHANYLRFIANKKNPVSKRKQQIIRKGSGLIAPLLSIAIPTLISLFSGKS